MADTAVKSEIKGEHIDDTDLANVPGFEEDTDLQFPPSQSRSWFAKVPPELWQAWHKIYNDAPEGQAGGAPTRIVVGNMRVHDLPEHADSKDQKVEITLSNQVQETRKLPQKYTLKLQSIGYNNTVVFSEKDLAGHSTPAFGRNRYLTSRPAGINKSERYSKKTGYQSAIPKQTALAPPIHHEAVVTAEVDAEHFFHSLEAAYKSTDTVRFESEGAQAVKNVRSGVSSFTLTSKPKGKKKPREKAVRMDQSQLYDAIYRCFSRYKYWRLGALRKELNQPEAFIKSTLDQVANLVRSGDFSGCYMLKPEYAQIQQIDASRVKEEDAQVESAADDGTDDATGDDMDDDFGDMEDVKMEGS